MQHRVKIRIGNKRCEEVLTAYVEAATRRDAIREAFADLNDEIEAVKGSFRYCIVRVSCMTYKAGVPA